MHIYMYTFLLLNREADAEAILEALRDENMYDPRRRIEIVQDKAIYLPQLLGSPRVASMMK